jgi:hypothetical protein
MNAPSQPLGSSSKALYMAAEATAAYGDFAPATLRIN